MVRRIRDAWRIKSLQRFWYRILAMKEWIDSLTLHAIRSTGRSGPTIPNRDGGIKVSMALRLPCPDPNDHRSKHPCVIFAVY